MAQHKLPLNEEEKEQLAELLDHDGIRPLLTVVDDLVADVEGDIIKLSLDATPASVQELLIRKARADGARRLSDALKRKITSLKSKKD